MKAIFIRPHYELHVDRKEEKNVVSVDVYSVWPQARTDRSPHKLLNLNLPKPEMDALADFIKGESV